VPPSTATDTPTVTFAQLAQLKRAVVASSVGAGVAGALLIVLAAYFLVRRLRQRTRYSMSSSFFPARRSTPDSLGAFLPSSQSRPPSFLFAYSGRDLEESGQEMLDELDFAGPSMQVVQAHQMPVMSFPRASRGALSVAIVHPTQDQVESCAASVIESASHEQGTSGKGALEDRPMAGEQHERDWNLESEGRPDTMHSIPSPEYASLDGFSSN